MPAIPSPRSGRRPRLEIIPFIDIMFFLLATFVMVSLSMIDNQGIDLNLPGANSAKSQDQTDHTQTVSVAKNGELFFNKEPITLSVLQERFSQLITGDPETRLVLRRLRLPVWTRRRGLRQRPHARIEQVGNSNGSSGDSVIPMSFEGAASFRSRPWLCQALSVLLHAAFFLAGGFLLTVAAEFGVDAGTGGHAPPEPQEMHAEVEIVEYETTPKVLPVVEEPVVTEEPAVKDEPVVAEEPSIQEELQEPEMPPVPEPSPTATPEPVVAQEADQLAQPAPAPTPIAKPPRRKASSSMSLRVTTETA